MSNGDFARTNQMIDGNLALQMEPASHLRLVEGYAQPARRAGAHVHTRLDRAIALACVLAFVILLLGGIAWTDYAHAAQVRMAQTGMVTQQYVVRPDDTIWGLAADHQVDGMDTKDVVSWIKDRNQLTSSSLSVGQTITIPAARG